MSNPIRAVAYYRMSSEDQETSIEQQQAWAPMIPFWCGYPDG